ncbi:MAG: acyltransferase [Bdellovibrionales bacterium]|nr:acyltransferase [Bdellovibrionales bacterium]
MRKISVFQIIIGSLWFLVSLIGAGGFGYALHASLPPTEYRSIFVVFAGGVGFLVLHLALVRLLLWLFPIPIGDIAPGSASERNYHIYLVYIFLVVQPLTQGRLLPVPMTRFVNRVLGAKIADNTYTAGAILDPQFVTIGSSTLLGNSSLLVPHVLEGTRIAHFPIRIGSHVTIGAQAIIMADVEIGDRVIVAMNSVVAKGTKIGDGEVWGGTPARRLS